jgi:uncharacterized membrane protein
VREIATEAPAPNLQRSADVGPLIVRPRLDAIDQLRGLVMVIMALDHVRAFLIPHDNPTDLSKTTITLFATRWVTHFCAPVFVFLAGTSIFLHGTRIKSKPRQAWFLLTRGLWIVLLELTLVHFGWTFALDYQFVIGQVIWAIGWSMVAMSILVFLPLPVVTAIGIVLIAGHNWFDSVPASNFGDLSWLWVNLKTGGPLKPVDHLTFVAAYPILPWLGVMAAGYGFGRMWLLDRDGRRGWLVGLGLVLTTLFVVLRWNNQYGDPHKWGWVRTEVYTFFSFLNCWKYPPSLLFLLMTLGPAMFALAWFDRGPPGPLSKPLVVFGRVPMFYYLLHAPMIHVIAIAFGFFGGWSGNIKKLFHHPANFPEEFKYDLWVVYVVWIAVVIALYPACKWYADFKRRRNDWWLSYV